ncbi:23S rRNA (cytidine(2498)-2'-O)-methyltransferase RlmM [Glaciecola sp. MH2013]|uniref:23S rRNA (cytidine(2498)-2'-O)-methyltransferase RlmM n=1 Tax=Glaciecola sp. MH2013 TaxID=2785524 RepID=UPI00189F7CE4|nr:23S rRNA (cytidine(2498)-2'-O)-methyltransferase RlmM [Glaciecola sp. MH2013]MBF7072994.1 23S rRNA (cytidine(2498)-2'-O)-methyltransferase RlmM [Glaciecola sp. MH2013]
MIKSNTQIDKSLATKKVVFYCREGYEADLAAELDTVSAKLELFGYSQCKLGSTLVEFNCYEALSLHQQENAFHIDELIFARQRLLSVGSLIFDKPTDRVGSVIDFLKQDLNSSLLFGDVIAEHADNESGKQIAKFCKKFVVPLRQAMRKSKLLSAKPNHALPYLHLYFSESNESMVCVSLPNNRHAEPMGITRLKMPADAPSRSTLKLEEAIKTFLLPNEQNTCFQKGMTAVDLGACPGGWTYQLVSRGLRVEAIDNGKMSETLMQTGLVEYHPADGFTYAPQDGHVDWLVCDMIEKPERVAELIASWLVDRKCTSSIFNLKLPMKRRFHVVEKLLAEISEKLEKHQINHKIAAKHLYHDRDEITVIIRSGMHLI